MNSQIGLQKRNKNFLVHVFLKHLLNNLAYLQISMNKISFLILTLNPLNKQVKLKPVLKVNQTVGMDAKYVFPLLFARFVKVQTLPFQKVFVHVKLNKLMQTLRSATPARMEPTGIKQRSVAKNARQVVLLVQTRRHVRLASQTM